MTRSKADQREHARPHDFGIVACRRKTPSEEGRDLISKGELIPSVTNVRSKAIEKVAPTDWIGPPDVDDHGASQIRDRVVKNLEQTFVVNACRDEIEGLRYR